MSPLGGSWGARRGHCSGGGPRARAVVHGEPSEEPPGRGRWSEKGGRSWPWGQRVHGPVFVPVCLLRGVRVGVQRVGGCVRACVCVRSPRLVDSNGDSPSHFSTLAALSSHGACAGLGGRQHRPGRGRGPAWGALSTELSSMPPPLRQPGSALGPSWLLLTQQGDTCKSVPDLLGASGWAPPGPPDVCYLDVPNAADAGRADPGKCVQQYLSPRGLLVPHLGPSRQRLGQGGPGWGAAGVAVGHRHVGGNSGRGSEVGGASSSGPIGRAPDRRSLP